MDSVEKARWTGAVALGESLSLADEFCCDDAMLQFGCDAARGAARRS